MEETVFDAVLARFDASVVLQQGQLAVLLLEDLVSLDHSIPVRTQHVDIALKGYVDLLDLFLELGSAG